MHRFGKLHICEESLRIIMGSKAEWEIFFQNIQKLFKNQKGLRSFWKMISIGISIIFGILACIDKFEKQWELNVFYFGIALLLFYIFIHPVWMDAKKKKGYKFEEDRIYVFNILGKQTRMIAYQTMEKAVQKRQVRCKNNGLVIGKGRNKICFFIRAGKSGSSKAGKTVLRHASETH